ncbi:replication initiator protein A [Deinococcus ruber]|uniref:Uncharacterized protein n=1 Tax=Deinococcus ruber TaxID=1848197 RepID=A0A918CB13_9DEIO|nr:replication initiator protein A [Deinococcus ruber]GGR15244.1 hypothetical protein GCM10008957_29970 [Deinococcus ruber]
MSKVRLVTQLGVDERNIARLNPVLGLNRVSDDLNGWTKSLAIDNLSTISITCTAGNGQVVPHGIDGDVMFALTALYVMQGKPENGAIEFSIADLCSVIGLTKNSVTYNRLQESIFRLAYVKFEVFESWIRNSKSSGKTVTSNVFGIIDNFKSVDFDLQNDERPWIFRPTTLVRVSLNSELVESIRTGHVRSIDLDFYGGLEQPFSRLLYRILEEQKLLHAPCAVFSVPLMTWGDHLGLRRVIKDESGKVKLIKVGRSEVPETQIVLPGKIRRALEPAHAELQKKGYLQKVEIVGIGQKQIIHYAFGSPIAPVDLELVGLLTQRGMSPKAAEQQARTYGPKAVNRAVEVFDARKAAGYMVRNAGGLLTDILVNPDKYVPMDASLPAKTGSVKPSKPVKPIIEAELAEPSIDEKRKTNAFVVDGWAKRKWLVGQQHQQLLDLVKHGRLDDAKLVSLGLADAVAVQKFAMEVLARG